MKIFKINEINDKRILGRNVKNCENSEKPLALFWGASALEINVKAKEVWIQFSSEYDTYEPWVAVEVNGAPVSRFMVHKGEAGWVCVAANLNPEKENLITILKDTQPMSGEAKHSLFIHAVGLSDEGTFCKIPPRKMNIEFIGDSITSGEGLAGSCDEGDWITQWFCASKTYAMQVRKKLNASWSVLSQCGWGICWGWEGNIHSNMPEHYDNVCSVMWGDYQNELGVNEKYDFSIKNDFVILNLGTNDNGAFFQKPWKDENGKEHILHIDENKNVGEEEVQKLSAGIKNFLKNIRFHNPESKIVWTWGMIKLDVIPKILAKAVEEYKTETGDNKVYLLELDSMEQMEKTEEDKGSRGHPGPLTHKLAAQKLIDFIQSL